MDLHLLVQQSHRFLEVQVVLDWLNARRMRVQEQIHVHLKLGIDQLVQNVYYWRPYLHLLALQNWLKVAEYIPELTVNINIVLRDLRLEVSQFQKNAFRL